MEYKNLMFLRLKVFVNREAAEFHTTPTFTFIGWLLIPFRLVRSKKESQSVTQASEKYELSFLIYIAQLLKNSSSQMCPFSLHVWSQITLEVSHDAEEPQKIIKVFCEMLLSLWDKPGALTCIARGLFLDPPENICEKGERERNGEKEQFKSS